MSDECLFLKGVGDYKMKVNRDDKIVEVSGLITVLSSILGFALSLLNGIDFVSSVALGFALGLSFALFFALFFTWGDD